MLFSDQTELLTLIRLPLDCGEFGHPHFLGILPVVYLYQIDVTLTGILYKFVIVWHFKLQNMTPCIEFSYNC